LTFQKIYEHFEDHFFGWSHSPELVLVNIKKGNYEVKMLDINELFEVGNDFNVESWLHAAHMRAISRHGRATRDQGTVYLGQHSRRWGLKFYNKWREMQAKGHRKTHELPDYLKNLGLEEFIKGKLRAELRIFSKELEQLGITHGYHLTPDLINQLFNTYLGKINMTTQLHLIDEQILAMPRPVQLSYKSWRDGVNLRMFLPKNTFYRHRRALLEYGVDISAHHLAPEHNNVVPMMRIIEAKPVAIPSWAYERGLIAA
jgi:II/X family phage/plasmid replication protein